ncbi:acyltransferase family protein [Agromyces sp. GXS1127]|uniref:acyltransferase family protein n=1 Tax=Agromyces sp. GXS1127 TaxID=3424181 RepID=UPI003D320A9F
MTFSQASAVPPIATPPSSSPDAPSPISRRTPQRPARRSGDLRADIQGLRAFAVGVVVLDHLFHWPSGGFVGVDVFFVISGYLITAHILRELDRTGRVSLSGFYRRRARRILPAAVLVITATVIAAALLLPRWRALSIAVDGVWATFFGANLRSMLVGTDYFQLGQLPSPLLHYWSLSVEEQFYFVWPLLAMAVFAVALARWGRRATRPAVIVVFAAVVAASFAWAWFETADAPTVAYFSTFSRAWELGAGALLAAVSTTAWRLPPLLRRALGWLGLAGLVVSIFIIDPSSPFPAPTALLPVLSAVAVIAAGIGETDPGYERAMLPLTNRAAGYLGAISYSVYLWHFPVIVLLPALVAQGSGRYFALALVLTAALSIASYRLVEQPVRRSRWLLPKEPDPRRAPRWRTVAVASGIIALVLAGGVAAGARVLAPTAEPTTPATADCFGAEAAAGADGECSTADDVSAAEVSPSLDVLPQDTAGGYSCWRGQGQEARTCTFGAAEPAYRVALVGDSHAAALLPAFLAQADRLAWSVDTFVGFGCQWREQPADSDCADAMAEYQHRLVDGDYDVVVTTAARWATSEASESSFTGLWDQVRAAGSDVVVVAAAPDMPESTLECLNRVGQDLADCATPSSEAFAVPDRMTEAAIAADYPVVDMTDFYCAGERCPAVIGNVIVYRDAAGHITGTFMKSMAPYLTARIGAAAGLG